MNLDYYEKYDGGHSKRLLKARMFMGNKMFLHKRQVYDVMSFLGDAGGLHDIMIIIGAIAHFLISFKEEPT